jgi:hypothetical protein
MAVSPHRRSFSAAGPLRVISSLVTSCDAMGTKPAFSVQSSRGRSEIDWGASPPQPAQMVGGGAGYQDIPGLICEDLCARVEMEQEGGRGIRSWSCKKAT